MSSVFNGVAFDIKYQLFKKFCMPLYGAVLWDFRNTEVKLFTVGGECVEKGF